jgi:mycothiol synthase
MIKASKVIRTKLASLLSLHMILADLNSLPSVKLLEGCERKNLETGLAEEFLHVLNRAYNRREADKNFLQALAKDPQFDPKNFVMIRSDGIPAAVAVAGHREWKGKGEFKGERIGFIENVGVDPDYRRQGFGRMISLLALQRLRERGFKYAILTSFDFRLPAIRLYQKLGFRPLFLHLGDKYRWNYVKKRLKKMA